MWNVTDRQRMIRKGLSDLKTEHRNYLITTTVYLDETAHSGLLLGGVVAVTSIIALLAIFACRLFDWIFMESRSLFMFWRRDDSHTKGRTFLCFGPSSSVTSGDVSSFRRILPIFFLSFLCEICIILDLYLSALQLLSKERCAINFHVELTIFTT